MADLLSRLRSRPVRWRDPAPRTHAALERFKWNLASANSHPLAAFLSFEAPDLGFPAPEWAELIADAEAEGSRLIGAVPCPDEVPHGWEHSQTGEVHDFKGGPCPSCGAIV